MRARDYFNIAFSRIRKRNTKTAIGVLCVSIAILMLMISNMLSVSIDKYRKGVQSTPGVRTIGFTYDKTKVSYEQLLNEIEKLNNENITIIEKANENRLNIECKKINPEEAKGKIQFRGTNPRELNALGISQQFSSDTAYEVILPSEMKYRVKTDEYDEESQNYIWRTYTTNCTEFIGDNMIIKIDEKEYEFKVIGTYNSKVIKEYYGYIPTKLVKQLKEENGIEELGTYMYDVYVTVEKMENIEQLQRQLNEVLLNMKEMDLSEVGIPEGVLWEEIEQKYKKEWEEYKKKHPEQVKDFFYTDMATYEGDLYNEMNISKNSIKVFNIIEIFLKCIAWIILITTIIFINTKSIYEKSVEYGIFKLHGYTNKNIQIIGMLENIMFLILSIIIALIAYFSISFGLVELMKIIIDKNIVKMYDIQMSLGGIIEMEKVLDYVILIRQIAMASIIIIINLYITNKIILKKKIRNLIYEKEEKEIINNIPVLQKWKSIIYIMAIIVLFFIIVTANNINKYMDVYYNELIEDITIQEAEKESRYREDSSMKMSIDNLAVKEHTNILKVREIFKNNKDIFKSLQVLKLSTEVKDVQKLQITLEEGKIITSGYIVIVNNWKDIPRVKALSKAYGYGLVCYYENLDEYINTYNVIKNILNIIKYGITILVCFIFVLYINRMVEEDKENIGILKTVGYSNFRILLKILVKILIITIIAYLLNYIILIGGNNIIDNFLVQYGFEDYNNIVKNNYSFGVFGVFIVISVITSIYTIRRLKKMNIIDILK